MLSVFSLLALLPVLLAQGTCLNANGDETTPCSNNTNLTTLSTAFQSAHLTSLNGTNGGMIPITYTPNNFTAPAPPVTTTTLNFTSGGYLTVVSNSTGLSICNGTSFQWLPVVVTPGGAQYPMVNWTIARFSMGSKSTNSYEIYSNITIGKNVTTRYLCREQGQPGSGDCEKTNWWNSTLANDGIFMVVVSTILNPSTCLWTLNPLCANTTTASGCANANATGFAIAALTSYGITNRYIKGTNITNLNASVLYPVASLLTTIPNNATAVPVQDPFSDYVAFSLPDASSSSSSSTVNSLSGNTSDSTSSGSSGSSTTNSTSSGSSGSSTTDSTSSSSSGGSTTDSTSSGSSGGSTTDSTSSGSSGGSTTNSTSSGSSGSTSGNGWGNRKGGKANWNQNRNPNNG